MIVTNKTTKNTRKNTILVTYQLCFLKTFNNILTQTYY